MRKMKKFTAIVLAAALSAGLAGCSSKNTATSELAATEAATEAQAEKTGLFQAGTYEASSEGLGGEIKVEVIVSDDRIESVKILSHSETEGISDPAIQRIPEEIKEAQGLGIDAVSGATITSEAILAAVEDCLAQAGADIAALKEKRLETQVKEDETLVTDVVVVGAGMAGLTAAIAAANEGADVIIVEKMGSVGGASITCGGEILAAGTEAQKAQGIEDRAEDLAEYWISVGGDQVDQEKLTFIAEKSAETVSWLADYGVEYGDVTFSYNYPNQNPLRNHSTVDGKGSSFILPLEQSVKDLGVKILLETPAVSLLKENGAITGVVCENGGRTITIQAKSTILATGGYANSEELMKEYAPAIGAYGTFLGEAHQGDGLIMARDAGAKIVSNGGAIVNPMDNGATKFADAGGIMLNVTPEGKRFTNENDYWFKRSAELYFGQGFNQYYGIVDSSFENDSFAEAIENGTVVKADTIEELAEKLDMDSAVFSETVNRYNELCKAKEDTDFGKPVTGLVGARKADLKEVSLLNSIEKAPFYAVAFRTTSVTGTFGGPLTTLDGEVVSTEGTVIPGLYAVGEVANGDLLNQQYPCSGTSIQFCATLGRQTGAAAANFAK